MERIQSQRLFESGIRGIERMIVEILKKGKQNAVPSKVLAKKVGCGSVRDLRAIVAQERQQGAVILSTSRNGGGYYLPADAEEVREFIRTLDARARHTFLALRSARKYLKELEIDNEKMEGVGDCVPRDHA